MLGIETCSGKDRAGGESRGPRGSTTGQTDRKGCEQERVDESKNHVEMRECAVRRWMKFAIHMPNLGSEQTEIGIVRDFLRK